MFEVSGADCTQERRAFVQDGMQHEADAESLKFELCALGHFSDESGCIGNGSIPTGLFAVGSALVDFSVTTTVPPHRR